MNMFDRWWFFFFLYLDYIWNDPGYLIFGCNMNHHFYLFMKEVRTQRGFRFMSRGSIKVYNWRSPMYALWGLRSANSQSFYKRVQERSKSSGAWFKSHALRVLFDSTLFMDANSYMLHRLRTMVSFKVRSWAVMWAGGWLPRASWRWAIRSPWVE